MALVNATITVNFNATYECTRVCWSTNPLGPFNDCLEDTFVVGASTFEIPIQVDPESCDPVTYYGYIQSCCEELGSLTGRVAWSAVYTPAPPCIAVRVTATTTTVAKSIANSCGNPGEFNAKANGTIFYVCYDGGVGGADFALDDAGPNGWAAKGYSTVDDPSVCCYNCYTYEVDCGAGATYQYINCAGTLIRVTTSGVDTICAKEGSISANNLSTIVITQVATTCTLP